MAYHIIKHVQPPFLLTFNQVRCVGNFTAINSHVIPSCRFSEYEYDIRYFAVVSSEGDCLRKMRSPCGGRFLLFVVLPFVLYAVALASRKIAKPHKDYSTDAVIKRINAHQPVSLWSAAKKSALQAKFSANPKAPISQEGTITYIFRLQ